MQFLRNIGGKRSEIFIEKRRDREKDVIMEEEKMNRNNLWKKAMIFTIVMLFVGASIIPGISGNVEKVNGVEDTDYIESLSSNSDVLFSDDFNDNSKNYDKWTEVHNDGSWEETDQKTVFTLHEHDPTYSINVQSSDIEADVSSNPVVISCDMISYLDHECGYVGQLAFKVTGQGNFIDVRYYRASNDLKVSDNKGTDITLFNKDETSTSWDITITIEDDQYQVEVSGYNTGWISKSILSDCASFNVIMYMEINGDHPECWWKAGFDNVVVNGETCVSNQPPYPPGRPSGDNSDFANVIHRYTSRTTDPDENDVYYNFSWGDGTYSDWLGPYKSGETIGDDHKWIEADTYEVKVRAKDIHGAESEWSDPLQVEIFPNDPPYKPYKPSGKTNGRTDTSYAYSSSTFDLDGDKIYYLFDWGDNTDSGWRGPYYSQETVEESHIWDKDGTYVIKVKAKDEHNAESVWSDPLSVSMPKSKPYINPLFLRFLEQHPRMFPTLQHILLDV